MRKYSVELVDDTSVKVVITDKRDDVENINKTTCTPEGAIAIFDKHKKDLEIGLNELNVQIQTFISKAQDIDNMLSEIDCHIKLLTKNDSQ